MQANPIVRPRAVTIMDKNVHIRHSSPCGISLFCRSPGAHVMTNTRGRKVEPGFLTVQRGNKTVCPASKFQQMVSGKYKLRILWGLQDGWKRYSEIKKGLLTGSVDSVEIAPRVLSRELKTLIAMGMVERRDHQVFPLKVEYRLTRKGRTFLPIIAVIHKWGMRHLV